MAKIIKAQDIINTFQVSRPDNNNKNTIYDSCETSNAYLGEKIDEIMEIAEREVNEIVEKTKLESLNIIEQAKREAEEIIAKAKIDADRKQKDAFKEGYEKGLKLGQDESDALIINAQKESKEIIEKAQEERIKILNNIKDDILTLSLNIAEKIILIELNRDDRIYKNIILNAINNASLEGEITLRISEEDYDEYFQDDEAYDFAANNNLNITFIKDRNLKKGDLILDTEKGSIDVSLDTQLENVKTAFGV